MDREVQSVSEIAADAQNRSRLHRRELFITRRHAPFAAFGIVAFLLLTFTVAAAPTLAAQIKSVVFLNVQFLNDHEAQEPTTDDERTRLGLIEELFKSKLEASGRYKFVGIPAETKARINGGPAIGYCGGCEIDYGKQLGSDLVAWVVVQKVSNLILNINVYMADVATKKMVFVQSADIRGNTDQSWARGITYIVKNHMLSNPL